MISKMVDLILSSEPPPDGDPTEELIEAAARVPEPHLVCVRAHGGMHMWENCTEEDGNSFDDLKTMAESVVAVVAEYISDFDGEEAVTLWLARLLCDNV
jgi:hypothetical protein